MPLAVYTIARTGDGWVVKLNHKDAGTSPSLPVAVEEAVRSAREDFFEGNQAHVMLCDGQQLHTVWMNGAEKAGRAAIDRWASLQPAPAGLF